MVSFAVRFKGILFKLHLKRLKAAGIVLVSSEPGMQIGGIKTGEPVNTVLVDAGSEEQAIASVRQKLTPDDVNFSNWEAEPA
jgi:hypothetical protein